MKQHVTKQKGWHLPYWCPLLGLVSCQPAGSSGLWFRLPAAGSPPRSPARHCWPAAVPHRPQQPADDSWAGCSPPRSRRPSGKDRHTFRGKSPCASTAHCHRQKHSLQMSFAAPPPEFSCCSPCLSASPATGRRKTHPNDLHGCVPKRH